MSYALDVYDPAGGLALVRTVAIRGPAWDGAQSDGEVRGRRPARGDRIEPRLACDAD